MLQPLHTVGYCRFPDQNSFGPCCRLRTTPTAAMRVRRDAVFGTFRHLTHFANSGEAVMRCRACAGRSRTASRYGAVPPPRAAPAALAGLQKRRRRRRHRSRGKVPAGERRETGARKPGERSWPKRSGCERSQRRRHCEIERSYTDKSCRATGEMPTLPTNSGRPP